MVCPSSPSRLDVRDDLAWFHHPREHRQGVMQKDAQALLVQTRKELTEATSPSRDESPR